MRLDWDNGQCQRVARQVEEIKALERGGPPLYVFAHLLVPHEPYVFTPDGRCLTRPSPTPAARTRATSTRSATPT